MPKPPPATISMWRDLNAFNEVGIPSICYGPPRQKETYTYEQNRAMKIKDLVSASKIYAYTAMRICGAYQLQFTASPSNSPSGTRNIFKLECRDAKNSKTDPIDTSCLRSVFLHFVEFSWSVDRNKDSLKFIAPSTSLPSLDRILVPVGHAKAVQCFRIQTQTRPRVQSNLAVLNPTRKL